MNYNSDDAVGNQAEWNTDDTATADYDDDATNVIFEFEYSFCCYEIKKPTCVNESIKWNCSNYVIFFCLNF